MDDMFIRLLVERGANPVAVNHDGDTPYDLVKNEVDDSGVASYLSEIIEDGEYDVTAWKQAEQNQMKNDSIKWLKERNRASANQVHPETGATPLHVATSKNFLDIMM